MGVIIVVKGIKEKENLNKYLLNKSIIIRTLDNYNI